MYRQLKKAIEEAGENVEFAQYGDGVSDEWIEKAEKRLCVRFPRSYRWWLEYYGGGEICGEEVFSIYEVDFDKVVGGDIVYINELYRRKDESFKDKLIVTEANDQIFYFDLSNGLLNEEYPIYEYYSKKKYADSFYEFLLKKIHNDAD